jgi:hypothetical protein
MRATKYLVIVFLVSLTATLAKNKLVEREGKLFKLCIKISYWKANSYGRYEMQIETCLGCCSRINRPLPGTPAFFPSYAEPTGPNEPRVCFCPANTEDAEEYKRLAGIKFLLSWIDRGSW